MTWRCNACGEKIDEGLNEWRKCARHAKEEHGDLEGPSFTAIYDG